MNALLETRALSASYGMLGVLRDINIKVKKGGVTVLLGANGAGKTTLLRAICNLMVRTEGEIVFDGTPIHNKATEAIAAMGIGHVPGVCCTFSPLTVEENLELGAYTIFDRSLIAPDMERMFGYFPRLKERRRQAAGTLSGGEQQMLAIGRALMSRPKLLLLDEPSFGLAPQVVHGIFEILGKIREADSTSMLLVEQNAKIALAFADQAYLLETGRVIMEGPAADLANDAGIRRSYLGY